MTMLSFSLVLCFAARSFDTVSGKVRPRHAVLHIGPPKTGTTHTQTWIAGNADRLKELGWAWPRKPNGAPMAAKALQSLPVALCGSIHVGHQVTLMKALNLKESELPTILLSWQQVFFQAASESPNLILSSELFADITDECKLKGVDIARKLRGILSEIGYQRFTILASIRTPLVEWLRSMYNQAVSQATFRVVLFETKHIYTFLDFMKSQSLEILRMYNVQIWRDAGWDVVFTDLEGTRLAGFDETDVLACDVLGVTSCRNGKWLYAPVPDKKNAKPANPYGAGAMAAAWKLYKKLHAAECSQVKWPNFYSNLTRWASGFPLQKSRCTNYIRHERRARKFLETILQHSSILHSVPLAAVHSDNITYCEPDPEKVVALPRYAQAMRSICANSHAYSEGFNSGLHEQERVGSKHR